MTSTMLVHKPGVQFFIQLTSYEKQKLSQVQEVNAKGEFPKVNDKNRSFTDAENCSYLKDWWNCADFAELAALSLKEN